MISCFIQGYRALYMLSTSSHQYPLFIPQLPFLIRQLRSFSEPRRALSARRLHRKLPQERLQSMQHSPLLRTENSLMDETPCKGTNPPLPPPHKLTQRKKIASYLLSHPSCPLVQKAGNPAFPAMQCKCNSSCVSNQPSIYVYAPKNRISELCTRRMCRLSLSLSLNITSYLPETF
jgi:hypothetical protein